MIRVPGDKSITHRALLLSALAEGESRLRGLLPGADCQSTASVLRALGAAVPDLPADGSEIRVEGVGLEGLRSPASVLDCGNSGTTARLLLGVLAGLPVDAEVTGDASLRSRPMRRVTEPLTQMGAEFSELGEPDRLPVRARGGTLDSIYYHTPVASAQVKSALLLAGLTGRVDVAVVEPSRSRDHTERMLRRAGVRVGEAVTSDGWEVSISGDRPALKTLDLTIPGDFSSAAFLIALGALGGAGEELHLSNVGLNPTRTGLLDLLREMGAKIEVGNVREEGDVGGEPAGDLTIVPSELSGVSVGGDRIPLLLDEIPTLAAVAALASGVTEIRDAAELRVKESDRISVVAENLQALGVVVDELPDGLMIEGRRGPLHGKVAVRDDHRIAMAFGILARMPGNRIAIDQPGIVEVSFPGFWELLNHLGDPHATEPAGSSP